MLTQLTPEQEKRMESLRAKDLSSLIGKEIIWHYPDDPEHTEIGIVVGIDPDLGYTIVNKKDKNDYLSCGLGILGKETQTHMSVHNPDKAITNMEKAIEQFEQGEYFAPKTLMQMLFYSVPSQEKCIFNQ
jgi:hypothetical protein